MGQSCKIRVYKATNSMWTETHKPNPVSTASQTYAAGFLRALLHFLTQPFKQALTSLVHVPPHRRQLGALPTYLSLRTRCTEACLWGNSSRQISQIRGKEKRPLSGAEKTYNLSASSPTAESQPQLYHHRSARGSQGLKHMFPLRRASE